MGYFKIEVENMSELKSKVYEEARKRGLSPDRIVILSKIPVKKKGFLGIGSKVVYQVWFQTLENNEYSPTKTLEKKSQSTTSQETTVVMDNSIYEQLDYIRKMMQEVIRENQEIRKVTFSVLRAKEASFDKLREKLLEKDFPPSFVSKIIEEIDSKFSEEDKQNFFFIYNKVRDIIAEGIKVTSTDISLNRKPKLVMLVGPTGVGKTTTLVKLATLWGFNRKARFCFLSLDKYRIGASQQLKTYADIFSVPMKTVTSKNDLVESLDYFASTHDIIFVDTAGTSQKNTMTITDLSEHVKLLRKYDCHISLVISAVTKYKDIVDIIKRYGILEYSNLIITKIDETNTLGSVVSAIYESGIPISFITNGQRVPEDIMTLKPIDLVQMSLDDIV